MSNEEILFGTKEWAPYNFNFMNGCSNDCTYCYAKEMAIRFKRKTPDNWKLEEPVSMKGKSFSKKNGRIMIPSSHDITPGNIDLAVEVIGELLSNGNELLIVTKPHFSCVKRLVDEFMEFRDNIQFRFTIGSASTDTLLLWEPGATGFDERLDSLKYAFNRGFSTTISAEPLLDEDIDDLYDALSPYVNGSIWVGKMNFPDRRVKMNGASSDVPEYVRSLVAAQCDENIIDIWKKYKDNPMIEWKESIKKVIAAHELSK
ncbi:MAG: radical SAM protein [Sphaerochaetaceae bacterium]